MDFKELAQKRYSLRKFSDKPVDRPTLESLLAVAQLAPTAMNYQPQRILVIESPQALEKLRASTAFHYEAPLALLVCYDRQTVWKRSGGSYNSGDIDVALAVSHIMLAAAEMGLGSTFVTGFDPEVVRHNFAVPEPLVPVCLLPLGYPAEDAKPSRLHGSRRAFAEYTYYNDFQAWSAE